MLIQVNIDCADLDRMAEFYCAALGYEPHGSAGDHYRSLTATDGRRPKLVFQKVAESKTTKNRVHLDVIVGPEIDAEAERWEGLGASRIEKVSEHGLNWIVMRDPEGNEICICDA